MRPRSRRQEESDRRVTVRDDRGDRAVSITVNYVIALSITAVLISGLLIAGGGYVESERDRVVREELEVVAEQLAVGIDDADRIARSTESTSELSVGVDLPARVASETYRIEVVQQSAPGVEPGRYELTLRPSQSDVSVTLTVSTLVPMDETSVNGGWVVVEFDTSEGTLAVTEDDGANALSLSRPGAEFGHVGGTSV